ncbi:hypothetical protein AGMMS50212_15900 [Spirochaetia bacterium]|nr:hypothetical protein AGMMS50212_15900 [Spirochaetia bacterium]
MTGLLKKTVEIGTLGGQQDKFVFLDENGKRYRIAAAGKTGTTQNWSDAWTVGFTPYYTTAIWFGFDKPGNSLGLTLTGATLAGPLWGDFMREVHRGLPARDFVRPISGVVDITVCAESGQLLTPSCNSGSTTLTFREDNHPTEYCSIHGGDMGSRSGIDPLRSSGYSMFDGDDVLSSLTLPTLNLDLLPSSPPSQRFIEEDQSLPPQDTYDYEIPDFNPLMD